MPRNVAKVAKVENVEDARRLLASGRYVADASLATAVFLALRLGRPLLLEGEAGVGKTEIAKVLAETLGRRLIRLQCYEGLDAASALYEWNYPRQMLEIRLAELGGEAGAEGRARLAHDIFDERFLLKRPLLLALEPAGPGEAGPPVLLVDEIDRTDEPFEAFLLEILSDFQVTIPEIGTLRAPSPPIVVLTSNRTREIHDALKRRCLYHWIGYPDAARELEILRLRAPELAEALAGQIVRFVQRLRTADLFKPPGVAETLDWARALLALDQAALDAGAVNATLGVLLKYQDDIEKVAGGGVQGMLAEP
ncbi:MAG TPA: MoxR family ATPase [Thermoanaerobaculia bacterium]|nr:MoxR family ATPase [Thermoanaerobaculia bacterium]